MSPHIFSTHVPGSMCTPALSGTPVESSLSLFPTVPSIRNLSDAEFVLYTHRSFGSPVLSTFLRAIRAGWLSSIPRLTPTIVLHNPPLALATSFGHLDACRKGLHSSQSSPPPSLLAMTRAQARTLTSHTTASTHNPNSRTVASSPCLFPTLPTSARRVSFSLLPNPSGHQPELSPLTTDTTYPSTLAIPPSISLAPVLHARLSHRSQWFAADLTGKYPVPSRLGHQYILISCYMGYISYTPQISRSAVSYRESFKSLCAFFSQRSQPITHIIMDNETSDLLEEFFTDKDITVEYVPPGDHSGHIDIWSKLMLMI